MAQTLGAAIGHFAPQQALSSKVSHFYDGNRSVFGDTSVATTMSNPDTVAAFAAQRSADGALTIMVISKYLSGNTAATINLANFTHTGVAQVWQLTAANIINRLADVGLSGNSFGVTLPPQSISLFVVAKNSNVPSPPNAPSNVTVTPDYANQLLRLDI